MKKSLDQIENLKTIRRLSNVAGWSSLVARQAHNLKVPGSNPGPAPNEAHRLNRWASTIYWPGVEPVGSFLEKESWQAKLAKDYSLDSLQVLPISIEYRRRTLFCI